MPLAARAVGDAERPEIGEKQGPLCIRDSALLVAGSGAQNAASIRQALPRQSLLVAPLRLGS
jgi:hypothetical protein